MHCLLWSGSGEHVYKETIMTSLPSADVSPQMDNKRRQKNLPICADMGKSTMA
jgi:hypothetical protein